MVPTLVVGVGTERGDDAAGLLVVRRLKAAGAPVTVAELAGDLTGLMDLWRPEDRVVVVDAVRTGAPAGTVHVLDAAAARLPAGLRCGSTHAFGLGEAVELARVLGRLPARLLVCGIEGSRWSDGTPPGSAVCAAVDRVLAGLCRPAVDPTSGPTAGSSADARELLADEHVDDAAGAEQRAQVDPAGVLGDRGTDPDSAGSLG
jgi:hydrogenase maturation protease